MEIIRIVRTETPPVAPTDAATMFLVPKGVAGIDIYVSDATGTNVRLSGSADISGEVTTIVTDAVNQAMTTAVSTAISQALQSYSTTAQTTDIVNTAVNTSINTALVGYIKKSELTNMLPSYVDDVIEVDNIVDLPSIGEKGKIYVVTNGSTTDFGDQYRWTGSTYIKLPRSLNVASDGVSEVTYGYNAQGAIETVTETVNNLPRVSTYSYVNDKIDKITITYEGKTITEQYAYDANGISKVAIS